MQAGHRRTSLRRPIERYEWPLGAAFLALAASLLMSDRKRRNVLFLSRRVHLRRLHHARSETAAAWRAIGGQRFDFWRRAVRSRLRPVWICISTKVRRRLRAVSKILQEHPQTRATVKIQFDSGAAAYKMKDYSKALESFSRALLSKDAGLQSKSHYNLGNTLYQRGDAGKAREKSSPTGQMRSSTMSRRSRSIRKIKRRKRIPNSLRRKSKN